MDKNQIVKHDEKFNDNKSSCFLKLKNGNLLCSVIVEDMVFASCQFADLSEILLNDVGNVVVM